jgi:hypothetical protein
MDGNELGEMWIICTRIALKNIEEHLIKPGCGFGNHISDIGQEVAIIRSSKQQTGVVVSSCSRGVYTATVLDQRLCIRRYHCGECTDALSSY